MRCLIDTNVLFSAALLPGSVPDRAFTKACTGPDEAFVCDYSFDELRRVFKEKFPDRNDDLEGFISAAMANIEVLHVCETAAHQEAIELLRDPKDVPILETALANDIDIIISGDKDFVVLSLEKPQTLTPASFIAGH